MHELSLFDQPKVERQTVQSLEQGLTLFTAVGMPAHHLSPRTRKEYQHDLSDLLAFLAKRGITTLSAVKLHDLEYYQAEMAQRGYKPSTIERKVYAIKTFFRFLYRHGLIDSNVSVKLIPPVVENQSLAIYQSQSTRPFWRHAVTNRAIEQSSSYFFRPA